MEQKMKFGAFLPPYHPLNGNPTLQLRRGLDLAVHLDDIGFDEIWYGEHHSTGLETIPAPDIYIAAAAERTKRIRFGTGVTSLPYHNPLIATDRIMLLDHLTRGRVIFGTGPGKLPLDAYMMGIEPVNQRTMQAESLEAVTRLVRGETVTMKTDWFNLRDARSQLLPFSPADFEIATASSVSPSGSALAGKHGLSLLSLAAGDPLGFEMLAENWDVYEKTSAQYGNVADRSRWRIVSSIFLAETREKAYAALDPSILHLVNYQEQLSGQNFPFHGDARGAIDAFRTEGFPGWGVATIGTPQDAIERIEGMLEKTGGFGTFLIMGYDGVSFEDSKRSYELFASEVMPHFHGSNRSRVASVEYGRDNGHTLSSTLQEAVKKATHDHYGDNREIKRYL